MTTALGRGCKLEFALTFSAAKDVTALTLASPGVATSTTHGMANGAVGYWTVAAGMVQLNGQATRVANQATNTFELQGLNTTAYSTWSGTQTYTPVATWGTLSEMTDYEIGGGSAEQLDDTKMNDVIKQIIFGLMPADVITISVLSQTANSATMQIVEDASIASSYLVGRITLQDGGVRVFRGVPSRPGENVARGQLGTGQFQIACKGFCLRGPA